MEFTITPQSGAIQVVALRGRLTFGPQSERCRAAFKATLAEGARRFVFDLSGVEYADSAGLGFLVGCLTSALQAGAELRLASPPEKVRHVLHITRLDTVFPVDAAAAQAMAHFGG